MLVVLIAAVYLARYAFPEKEVEINVMQIESGTVQDEPVRAVTGRSKPGSLYTMGGAGGKQVQEKKTIRKIIELNTADSALLETLPGIGPVLAARTIKYRNLLGGFASVAQLREVYGLREETYIIIEPLVSADTLLIEKIEINNADFAALLRHPYLERYDATSLLRYRELSGRIKGMHDIVANKLIDSLRLKKIAPYISFR